MKSIILVALFAAVAVALPTGDPKTATINKYENDNIGVEGYRYAVETSDGKFVQEEGAIKNVGTEAEALGVRGQFSYVGPDGITYTVTYIADENGFQPSGPHLPVAPVA